MKSIKTCNLWTETTPNSDCAKGAFIDGWQSGVPYEKFKIILNCNCIIKSNTPMVQARNKHAAIVFYGQSGLRLCVLEKGTDLRKAINDALKSKVDGTPLHEILKSHGVRKKVVDLAETPIAGDIRNTTDIGSCDRPALLKSMLSGSWGEENIGIGIGEYKKYIFLPGFGLMYSLVTDTESFLIEHRGTFHAVDGSQTIPIQIHGSIKKEDIEEFK